MEWIFGNAMDGDYDLGAHQLSLNLPAWCTRALITPNQNETFTQYTLTRDVFFQDLRLHDDDGKMWLKTNGYRIFVNGTLLIDSNVRLHNNGLDAVLNAAGGNRTGGSIDTATGAGSAGIVNAGSGTQATAVTNSAATTSTSTTASGGAGGASSGGGTGGGTAGAVKSCVLASGSPRNLAQAVQGSIQGATTRFAGGGGGSAGNSTASSTSGGGGAGGGVMVIVARKILSVGTISCNGGVGGAASGSGTGAGGGGGGGGGALIIVYGNPDISTLGTLEVNGGVGGALQGAGATGGTGNTGLIYRLPVPNL